MFRRVLITTVTGLFLLGSVAAASAQLSDDARVKILYAMIATEGGARLAMPLGGEGIELSDAGQLDVAKLRKELQNNGSSIAAGQVVTITAVEFGDKSIEVELDGGGTKKKSILSRIQVGVGGVSTPQSKNEGEAKGSKITVKFASRIQPDLTPEQLKDLLNPVLDFSKQSLARTGLDALPPEFKEAVLAKRAMIGMDSNTVLLALGQPNNRHREKDRATGVELVDWEYRARVGDRVTFVTFEGDVVVSIREY